MTLKYLRTFLYAINIYRIDLFWRCFFKVGAISAWCKLQAWNRTQNKFLKQCPCAFPIQRDGSSVCAVARLCCSEMERTGPKNTGTIYLPIHNRCSFQTCANSDNVSSQFVIWAIQHLNWIYDLKSKGTWLLCLSSLTEAVSLVRFLCDSLCIPPFFTDRKILSTCSGLLQTFQWRRTQKKQVNAERGATLASRPETTRQPLATTHWYVSVSHQIDTVHRKPVSIAISFLLKFKI